MQSPPAPLPHAVNESRLAAAALEQRPRHVESSVASMQLKNWSESHADWQRMISKASPPELPDVPPEVPEGGGGPPVSPPTGFPHSFVIAAQAVPTTQSIWYWYADFAHSLRQMDFSPTLMKLH